MAAAAWRDATRAQRAVVLGLVVAALGIRVVLAVRSPQPYGYMWDFYHQGVRHLYETGELPQAEDCYLCWHPPASFVAGWPFYAVGQWVGRGAADDDTALRWLNLLPLLCGGVVLWYGWRLVALFGIGGGTCPWPSASWPPSRASSSARTASRPTSCWPPCWRSRPRQPRRSLAAHRPMR